MIIRIEATQPHIPVGHIVMSDLQKGRQAIKGISVLEKPYEAVENIIKSFWTVLSHDTK